jgi:DNA-directed RNA polymerase I, II, and III subunit RPABC1
MDISHDVIKSFSTVREMFVDRAKHDPSMWHSDMIGAITEEWLQQQALKQLFIVPLENSIKILYSLQSKFKVPDLRKFVTSGKLAPDDIVIIVTVEKPSSTHMKTLRNMFNKIQVFEMKNLLYNVTKHELVPLHEVMNDADVLEVMERFNIKIKAHLPHILSSDPVAQYLALRAGQVVRIKRSSPSAGTYEGYRLCV